MGGRGRARGMGRAREVARVGGSVARSQTFGVLVGLAAGLLVATLVLPSRDRLKVVAGPQAAAPSAGGAAATSDAGAGAGAGATGGAATQASTPGATATASGAAAAPT